jgi:hypothetical protein
MFEGFFALPLMSASPISILTVSDVTEEMVALLDPARREEITRGSASPCGSMHRKTQFVVTERLPRTLEAALATLPRPIPLEWGLAVVVGVRCRLHGLSSVTTPVTTRAPCIYYFLVLLL